MPDIEKQGVLEGRRKGFLVCELDASGQRLLAGSEDGSVFLFDLRTRERMHHLLQGGKEEVPAVLYHPGNEHLVLVAVQGSIHTMDVRQEEGGPAQTYSFNSEDINSMAINKRGNFLAAADDSGQVKVVSLETHSVFKTLRGGHSNICSTVQFHPRRPWEVLSGGLDSRIVRWDFSLGRQRHIWDCGVDASASAERTFNPPLVHSLAVPFEDSRGFTGRLMAAARGDGVVALYDMDASPRDSWAGSSGRASRSRLPSNTAGAPPTGGVRALTRAMGGHAAAASHVAFAKFSPDADVLVSGGNDSRLAIWNWAATPGEQADAGQSQPNVLAHKHGRKINWMATSNRASENLVVADTSKRLTVYTVK